MYALYGKWETSSENILKFDYSMNNICWLKLKNLIWKFWAQILFFYWHKLF